MFNGKGKQFKEITLLIREEQSLFWRRCANLSFIYSRVPAEPFCWQDATALRDGPSGVSRTICARVAGVLRPGNAVFARLKRPAKIRDQWVGGVFMRIDGPAAEIEGRNIAGKFRKFVRSIKPLRRPIISSASKAPRPELKKSFPIPNAILPTCWPLHRTIA